MCHGVIGCNLIMYTTTREWGVRVPFLLSSGYDHGLHRAYTRKSTMASNSWCKIANGMTKTQTKKKTKMTKTNIRKRKRETGRGANLSKF